MIKLVISGGQAGVDQAAWRAARRCGIDTSGYMPRHFMTEDGPRPEFAAMYDAIELPTTDYPTRTRYNAEWAGITVWLGECDSPGFYRTRAEATGGAGIFVNCLILDPQVTIRQLAETLAGEPAINFAGSRESRQPGIGKTAEEFLVRFFTEMGHPEKD